MEIRRDEADDINIDEYLVVMTRQITKHKQTITVMMKIMIHP
jgi:hypothetical protein